MKFNMPDDRESERINIEAALDYADFYADENEKRYTHDEVFSNLWERINGCHEIHSTKK